MALSASDFLSRVSSMRLSRSEGKDALYKPLLLLLLLGHAKTGARKIPFAAVEAPLVSLLEEYGGDIESVGKPWWHLPTDRLWRVLSDSEVLRESGVPRGDNHVPSLRRLRSQWGEFPLEIQELLAQDSSVVANAIERLLARYFNHLSTARLDGLRRTATGQPRQASDAIVTHESPKTPSLESLQSLKESIAERERAMRSAQRHTYTNVGTLNPSARMI